MSGVKRIVMARNKGMKAPTNEELKKCGTGPACKSPDLSVAKPSAKRK